MRATDIEKLPTVSRPTTHPSAARAVVAVSYPHLGANASVGQLWSVGLEEKSEPRRITRGFRDSAPQFSPDGLLLAFVRSAPGAAAQIHLMAAGGGETLLLTDAPLGVESFRWSPSSRTIVFAARVPEPGRYGNIEGLAADAEAPRRQTTLRYRSNGVGYSNDRRTQLFSVEVPGIESAPAVQEAPSIENPTPASDASARGIPAAKQLTPNEFDHGSYDFARDGSSIRVVSARHPGHDDDLRHEVYELSVTDAGAEPKRILAASANLSIEQISTADDDLLFVLAADVGESGRDFVARNAGVYLLEAEAPRRLSDAETIDLGDGHLTPLPGGSVLAQLRTRGTVRLVELSRDGSVRELTAGAVEVTGHAAVGGRTVFSFQDAATSGDVALFDGGELRILSDFSAAVRETGIVRPREFTVQGRDDYPIHGWVFTPEGPGTHPVLLNIHGGPFHFYSVHLLDEAQVYLDAGYAVVMCNPRGSAGYGQAHGRAIRQQMGTFDHHDVIDFLEGALASSPSLDANRLGVMGGSYGGYLTAWIIAHDERFAGAIVERGFLDPESFVGTSDIGDFFGDEYTGTDPEQMRAQSPQAVIDGVLTPTLVLHSEDDLRCPLGQAERYYAALKRRGVESELLVFPGENHELSRSGRPRHRVQRFDAILDWWSRMLPSAKNPAPHGSA